MALLVVQTSNTYCYLCQDPESAVVHDNQSCPNVKYKICGKKGHVVRNCPNLNLDINQKLQTNTPRIMDADVPNSNYRELSIDTIDFLESIEFPCDFKLKTEIKQEGECCIDNIKSESIIRPRFEPSESLNSGQSEIKVKPKVEVKDELIEPKKETDDEFQNGISVLGKMDDSAYNGETFTNDSLPQQYLTSPSSFENSQFSDDVKPKVEVKDELIEPKKETDDEFQNGISELEKMDDSDFIGETFTNDSLPQQNLTSTSGSKCSQFDVDPKKPFQCLICPTKFVQKGALNRHILTVHEGIKPHNCPICESSFSQKFDLRGHITSVHEGKKPHCQICESNFAEKFNLRRHIKSVHEGKKPHKCQICESSFAEKSNLRRHMESVHEGKKPHKCPICESSFAEKSDLRQHMASVHEGKKPHKCPICESSFSKKSILRQHMESVHEGKKPHKCPICESSYSQKSHLRGHITSVHEGKKPHKCQICESSFAEKSNLRQHITSVHEGKK